MKEAYVEFFVDALANYRIDNPDNHDNIWKYSTESALSAIEKVGVGQRRTNADNRHNGGIIPLMI